MLRIGYNIDMYLLNPYIYGGAAALTNDYSLLVDGVDEGGDISSSLYSGQTKFSWSYWFKVSDSNQQMAVNLTSLGSPLSLVATGFKGGEAGGGDAFLDCWIYNGGTNGTFVANIGSQSSVENVWNHAVIVYDGTQATNADRVKFYFNGTLKTTSTQSTTMPTSIPNQAFNNNRLINRSSVFGILPYEGYIDEFAMFDGVALDSTDVTEIYNSGTPNDLTTNTTTPSHWWRFGDGSGDDNNTIYDQVGAYDMTGYNLEAGDIQTDVP